VESVLLLLGGIGAGVFGSLLGLGGGVLIVPLLTLGAGLPIREAVGVSLVCVIVNSGTAAGVFLRRRTANLRLGMLLELSTAAGALVGGLIAFLLPDRVLAGLFAILLGYVATTMLRASRRPAPSSALPAAPTASAPGGPATSQPSEPSGPAASDIRPTSRQTFVDRLSGPGYAVHHLRAGSFGGLGAGVVSALLGIGGGIIMVPVMNLVMGVPLRVATATSNLILGVTATASAVIYLMRGGIDAYVAAPTAIGVFVGASFGARIVGRVDVRLLRLLFVVVMLYVALQMVLRALGVS
jgi:uncharacterized membrane protein YfcA